MQFEKIFRRRVVAPRSLSLNKIRIFTSPKNLLRKSAELVHRLLHIKSTYNIHYCTASEPDPISMYFLAKRVSFFLSMQFFLCILTQANFLFLITSQSKD